MDFETLYHLHKNKVYNLALQYVQHAEDAQEITQDVFVAAHGALSSFKGSSTIGTWLYRITINKSLDFIKARNRKKRWAQVVSIFREDGVGLKHDPPQFDHPGVQLEQKEGLKRLFHCLDQLPENQRTALILSKIEKIPQAEIAEIMELSIKAVESLVQRAKTNLAKKMTESEGL